jgi:hypothetical protein
LFRKLLHSTEPDGFSLLANNAVKIADSLTSLAVGFLYTSTVKSVVHLCLSLLKQIYGGRKAVSKYNLEKWRQMTLMTQIVVLTYVKADHRQEN